MNNIPAQKQEFRWSYQKKGSDVYNVCTRVLFFFGLAVSLMGGSTSALANPTGGNVVGGSATITNTPTELQIHQTSQKALIEWKSFDIAKGETTRFYQPNSKALALNRVVNADQVSAINGNLIANGRVVIINPNGVLIGKTGKVDTAGFVASTADIANSAFMNGTGALQFSKAGKANGSIVNEGQISVADEGLVALVAPEVRNDGVIAGKLSKIQLGAADTFSVDLNGDGLINLAVESGQGARTIKTQNNGSIVADGGAVLMTAAAASNVVNSVINNAGVVQAQGISSKNGEIVLTGAGANVTVSGTLDASGANGGGTVKVGGDYQGKGALARAATVNVTSTAKIDVSATDNGNGGTAVVWSDKDTSFNGTALAKGGANGGNGGLVETSSAEKILLNGTVDASAANGAAGTYLIDPATLNIKNGSGSSSSNTIYEQTVESYSQGGTNVVLTATDTVTLENLSDNQLKGGKGNITLSATGSNGKVVFSDKNDTITTTSGNISVVAGSGGIDIGSLSTESGDIALTTTNGGDIATRNLTLNSKIGTVSELTATSAGSLTVTGNISNVNVDDKASADNSESKTVLSAQDDVNVTGSITASAKDEDQPYIGAKTTVSITSNTGNVTVGGPIVASATGTKTSSDSGNGPTVKTEVKVKAAKDVTLNGAVTLNAVASSNADYTSTTDALLDVNGKNVTANGAVNVNATTTFTDLSTDIITSTTNAKANITASNNIKVGNVTVNANGVVPVDTILKFLSTSSSYNDSFGYYTYDSNGNPVSGKIIWAGAQNTAANTTVVLPTDQGSIGFFLLSNGKTLNSSLSNGQNVTFKKESGVWQAYVGSTKLKVASSGDGPFFSNAALNPDGEVHSKTVNSSDTGWEDLQVFSDEDYNDVIINIADRYNNNNVTATLNIKTDAAGTGVVTMGNLQANANTEGTGVAKSVLDVYSSGVLVNNGTIVKSTADGAAAQDPYVGFDINKTVNSGTDQAIERISSLHIINVKADAKTKTYGSSDPALTYTAKFDYAAAAGVSTAGYLTGALTRAAGNNVGSYAINQGSVAVASAPPVTGRYVISYTGSTLTINPATLTISALSSNKTYDGTTTSSGAPTVSGLKYSDTVTNLSQVYDSKNAGTRTLSVKSGYVVNDGNGGNNYTVVLNTASGSIAKALLTLAAVSSNKTYDGNTSSSGVVTKTGLVGGDTVTGLSQSYDSKNAGSRTLSVNNGYTVNDGNGGNNYTVVKTTAAGNIAKANLTLAAVSDSKTYDGTTTSSGVVTKTGLVGGDTVTNLSQSYDSKNAGSRTLSVNNGYVINDGNNGGNYNVTTTTASGSIAKALLTLAAVSSNKTYDGNTSSTGVVTKNGLVAGDTVSNLSQSYDSKNAGSRTLSVNSGYTVNDGNGGNNYTVVTTTASGSIAKALLTLAAVSSNKTYDGNTSSTGAPTTAGLVSGDTVTGLSQSYDSKNAGSRTLSVNNGYTVNDGNGGNNYTVVKTTAAGSIAKALLTLTAASDTKTYDGTTSSSGTATASGLVGGDTISGLTQTFDSKNAGNRTLSVTGYTINDGNNGGNYTIAKNNASGLINKAALTIAAVSTTKTYDGGTTSSGAPTVTGLVGGDTVTNKTQAYASKNVMGTNGSTINVTNYKVNDGNNGGNYTVTTTSATGTINKANLVVAAVSDLKVYDGTTDSNTGPIVLGLKGSDTVTGRSQAFDSKNVQGLLGSTISVTGYTVNDGNAGGNYNVTTTTAKGTITPAILGLVAQAETKTYDGTTDTTKNPLVLGLKGSDTVTGVDASYDSKNAGVRAITVDSGYSVNDGNNGNNYIVVKTAAVGLIKKADLTLAAVSDTKAYDGTTTSTGAPTITGLVAGDTVTLLSQSFDSKDAGARTLSVNSGYALNDGNNGGNYNVTTTTAQGNITQAGLTVAANGGTKVYGDADPSLTYVVTGLVGGDTLSGDLERAVGENVGSYAINLGTLTGGGNYAITYTGANLDITKATLTLTAAADTKVYDGTTSSAGAPTVTGLKFKDSVSGLGQSFDSKNAGNRTLNVDGGYTVNDNNNGGNYDVVFVSAQGNITPASLTIVATPDAKTFDGNTSSTGVPSVNGLVGGDTVTNLTQSFDSNKPGSRVISVDNGYSLNDGNNGGNYTVTLLSSQGFISQKPLTVADLQGLGIDFDQIGRPIVSVADKVINFDSSFEPRETQTMNVDVSIKGGEQASASDLANIEPAAGGDDDEKKKKSKGKVAKGKTAQDLANIEPAAGGNAPVAPQAPQGNFSCASDFLDGVPCAQ